MRWTRSVARALTRWTDRGLFGDFKHLLEVVVPVVLVGEDRPDVERIIFSDGSETSAAAGNFVRYAVEAQTGAVELVAFGVGRPSNPLNLLPDQLPQLTAFAAPTRPPGSQGAWSASTPAGGATVSLVRGPTNETVWLPVAGMIIPQGFEWGVRQATLNDSLFGVAFWRNVASSPQMALVVPPRAFRTLELLEFVRRVERAGVTGTVTSWWRSSSENRRVGGCEGAGRPRALCAGPSKHLTGLAFDVQPRGARLTAASAFRRQGLRVLDEGDHLHVQA